MIKKFNCSPPFWSKTSNNSSPGDDECKLNKWNLDQLAEFQDTFAGSYLINPRMLRKSVLDLWALISSGAVLFLHYFLSLNRRLYIGYINPGPPKCAMRIDLQLVNFSMSPDRSPFFQILFHQFCQRIGGGRDSLQQLSRLGQKTKSKKWRCPTGSQIPFSENASSW